jgi:4-aminobutyrate---pyruvate transaminase
MDPKIIYELDVKAHFHSQTNPRAHEIAGPLTLTKGDGVFVEDIEGNRFLESMSGLWYANLGFSNRRLIDAAHKQLDTLPCYHTFNHRSNDKCAELAGTLSRLVPLDSAKLFFVNSGSEAIDTMIKTAWYYHTAKGNAARRKIITRDGAFHGSSIFGAVLSGLPHMHTGFNLPADSFVLRARSPNMYRLAEVGETEQEFASRLIEEIKAIIEHEGAETIAAMVAEPIMGAGGVVVPPQSYFAKLSQLLKEHDILLLMDEIICGFGRTGSWFGSLTFGAQPDMIAMAKGLTAGYVPMGAVAISGKVYEAIADQASALGTFGHGYTYSGHPVASAVALEAINIYQEFDTPQRVSALGRKLKAELAPFQNHPLVGEIRCEGFIAGIELVADRKTKTGFAKELQVGKKFERNALKEGLIVRNMNDTIALCPPYIISDEEFALMIAKLGVALDATSRQIKQAA